MIKYSLIAGLQTWQKPCVGVLGIEVGDILLAETHGPPGCKGSSWSLLLQSEKEVYPVGVLWYCHFFLCIFGFSTSVWTVGLVLASCWFFTLLMWLSLWFPLSRLLLPVPQIQACFCFQCMLFGFVIGNNFFHLLIITFTWPRTLALMNSCSISSSNKVPPGDDFFYSSWCKASSAFPVLNAFCSSAYHPSLDLKVPRYVWLC